MNITMFFKPTGKKEDAENLRKRSHGDDASACCGDCSVSDSGESDSCQAPVKRHAPDGSIVLSNRESSKGTSELCNFFC